MAKYRKKPVVVKAEQFTQEHEDGFLYHDEPLPTGVTFTRFDNGLSAFLVTTIHGQETYVKVGDWIIQEPDGKHYYPCKPDIFEATYELVGDSPN